MNVKKTFKNSFKKTLSYKKKNAGSKSKISGTAKSNITKICKSVISRDIENKTIQQFYENVPIKNYNSSGWATENFGIPVSPQSGCLDIFHGNGQGSRIGNTIKIKKLTMKGVMFPASYSLETNLAPKPMEIKFWFCYQKNGPTLKPTAYDTFFQNGNNTQNFSTNVLDMVKTVNADTFRVFKTKIFKLGSAAYEHAGVNSNYQRYANNDFKLNHKFSFDLTPYVVKTYKYLDNNNSLNMQRGLFLVCEAVWANGQSDTLFQLGEIQSLMSYTLSCEYEDA